MAYWYRCIDVAWSVCVFVCLSVCVCLLVTTVNTAKTSKASEHRTQLGGSLGYAMRYMAVHIDATWKISLNVQLRHRATAAKAPIGLSAADVVECHAKFPREKSVPCDAAFRQNTSTTCSY